MAVFTIDGRNYDVEIVSLKRKFSVLDGDKAGRAADGSMMRNIIGTYYNYSMQINTERLSRSEYDSLYEILSAPVDSHTVVLPYGRTILTQKMYVTGGEDDLRIDNAGNIWDNLSIEFVAMTPKRKPT